MKPLFRKAALFLAFVLIASTVLTACAGGGGGGLGVDPLARLSEFYMTVQNDNTAIEGGWLRYAVVSDNPFAGIFAYMFNEDAITSQIGGFFWESFLDTDENRVFSNDGAATYTYDKDAETFTITVKPEYRGKLFWHDGAPVTLDDLLFAYEVICHPDYDGVRYDSTFTAIKGVEEYHAAGGTGGISGITISADGHSMTFDYKDGQFPPSLLSAGIWVTPEPRHYYEGIPVSEMRAHEKSRSKAIGFGPFKLVNVVEGESARLERYDDYYKGAPKVEGVIAEVVAAELFPVAMQEGRFDVGSFNVAFYTDYMDPTNYQYLGSTSRGYGYVGFKLGHWDGDRNLNIPNPNAKMADVNLRRAIAYAHDAETVGQELYNNLRWRATTIISPFHGGYQDKSLTGFYYDPDKANQILDDAGYALGDDGWRTNPDGSPLVINYAAMSGGELAETLAQMALQDWRAVGLNVQLATGSTIEFNLFYDLVDQDYEGIDMYAAAWSVGFDPNPAGIWGHDAFFNMTRYTNDRLRDTMENIGSSRAWDDAYREEQYSNFQKFFEEDMPAFPTLWRIDLTAVNNRVKNYSVDPRAKDVLIHMELTRDTPYAR